MSSVGVEQLNQLGQITITLFDNRRYKFLGSMSIFHNFDTSATMYDLHGLLKACPNITINYVVRSWRLPACFMGPVTPGRFRVWFESGRALRLTRQFPTSQLLVGNRKNRPQYQISHGASSFGRSPRRKRLPSRQI
jgi:hypothetical protein